MLSLVHLCTPPVQAGHMATSYVNLDVNDERAASVWAQPAVDLVTVADRPRFKNKHIRLRRMLLFYCYCFWYRILEVHRSQVHRSVHVAACSTQLLGVCEWASLPWVEQKRCCDVGMGVGGELGVVAAMLSTLMTA